MIKLMTFRNWRLIAIASCVYASCVLPAQQSALNAKLPTLFLVGDVPTGAASGVFDAAHLNVVASAAGGRTTRGYINSGEWDRVLAEVKPGDTVLLEFAPATLSDADKTAATRTLNGIGDGTFDYLDPGTQKLELVHSYGWYLRRMVVDTINHGASPILCSPPGATQTAAIGATSAEPVAADWTKAIATEQRVPFVDLTSAGLEITPGVLRAGLEALQPDPLGPYLKKAGQ